MDRLTELELFVQAAELKSLSMAAASLNLSNPSASRYLTALEQRLGARLMHRSTRRMILTDAGEAFYKRCKSLLGELREAESAVNGTAAEPSGTLTVGCSLSFAINHVNPVLKAYWERYPKVRLKLEISNKYLGLLDSGLDIAIRTQEAEPDSNIIVRKLAETRRILTASPTYLLQHGTPKVPTDLLNRELLLYSYSNKPDELFFSRRDQKNLIKPMSQHLKVKGLLESNDGQVLRAAAFEGLGILVQPKYIVFDDIAAGRLIPVLDDWELPLLTINLAYPSRKHQSATVRTFTNFMLERFHTLRFEEKWTQ
jgi:DNA-binding transcriptional LysR family regulator